MRREYISMWYLTWCFLLFLSIEEDFKSIYISAGRTEHEYSEGCTHLRCENGSRCIKRRFWCRNPPCPGMLYCSKSRKETLKGPSTCDTVRCSRGNMCIVKVRECQWDKKCKQQIARCISKREYYEGFTSCAGFECPVGKHCILRESYCIKPPCKLLKSCAKIKDVQVWFESCRILNCPSEYECFLRRPDNNCLNSSCIHTPDCMLTAEDKLINKHCRGWICPRLQKCVVRIVGSCKGFNCIIERSCSGSFSVSSTSSIKYDIFTSDKIAEQFPTKKTLMQIETDLIRQDLERQRINVQNTINYPIISQTKSTSASTSTWMQDSRYTIQEHETGTTMIHQQSTTIKSTLITESLGSSLNAVYSTLSYPSSQLNHNGPSTTIDSLIQKIKIANQSNTFETPSKSSGLPENSYSQIVPLADKKIQSTTSSNMNRLEILNKIYVATGDIVLPILLEGVSFAEQGYPIWIRDELHRSMPLEIKDENVNGWQYPVLQEPYRILLPPYEPVILVDGQFPPFLTYVFDRTFNEATLMSSPFKDITENSKTDNILTVVEDGTGNYINDQNTAVKISNSKTNHFDDLINDYASVFRIKTTNVTFPKISNKDPYDYSDDYERQSRYMTYDYPEGNKSRLIHEQRIASGIEYATDDLYGNDTLAETKTTLKSQITNEREDYVSEMLYTDKHNKNLAKLFEPHVPISTEQSDYISWNEKYNGLVNYPYDMVPIHNIDKSWREYPDSSLDSKILPPRFLSTNMANGGTNFL